MIEISLNAFMLWTVLCFLTGALAVIAMVGAVMRWSKSPEPPMPAHLEWRPPTDAVQPGWTPTVYSRDPGGDPAA